VSDVSGGSNRGRHRQDTGVRRGAVRCRDRGGEDRSAQPAANAYAARWVRTARAEVTDRLLIAGSRHLRAVLGEYAAHYNRHRPHRARTLRLPDCADITTVAVTDLATAAIRRREVLGGADPRIRPGSMIATAQP
jgi:Integrase core domain